MGKVKDAVGDSTSKRRLERLSKLAPRLDVINKVTFALAIALSIAAMVVMGNILSTYHTAKQVNKAYDDCERTVATMQEASDYLTAQARLFVTTTKINYANTYLAELQVRDRRGKAVKDLESQAKDPTAVKLLSEAERYSNELAQSELYAMRLVTDTLNESSIPDALADVELTEHDAALSNEEKLTLANQMVYGEAYLNKKLIINNRIHSCTENLMNGLRNDIDESDTHLGQLLNVMRVTVIALLLMIAIVIVSTSYLVLWPMSMHVKSIREDAPLVSCGARELRYLTDAYNEMYEEKHLNTLILQQEAETDGLTSLLNRTAFETLIGSCMKGIALMLVDVDYFKRFNDDFGHDMGDAVLIEVAATLLDAFRTSDYVCRIGGDEFAVIMTNVDSSMREVVVSKITKVTDFLRDTENGLPSVTISVGVAFESDVPADGDIFRTADQALYVTKRRGRDGYTFAGDE